MEEFTDSYLKSMEANFPAKEVDAQPTTATDSISLRLPIYPEHAPKRVSNEPHPRELEPPPKKQKVRF